MKVLPTFIFHSNFISEAVSVKQFIKLSSLCPVISGDLFSSISPGTVGAHIYHFVQVGVGL